MSDLCIKWYEAVSPPGNGRGPPRKPTAPVLSAWEQPCGKTHLVGKEILRRLHQVSLTAAAGARSAFLGRHRSGRCGMSVQAVLCSWTCTLSLYRLISLRRVCMHRCYKGLCRVPTQGTDWGD